MCGDHCDHAAKPDNWRPLLGVNRMAWLSSMQSARVMRAKRAALTPGRRGEAPSDARCWGAVLTSVTRATVRVFSDRALRSL